MNELEPPGFCVRQIRLTTSAGAGGVAVAVTLASRNSSKPIFNKHACNDGYDIK